jgi:hypothetical protein
MTKASLVVVALVGAIGMGRASAQPGETPASQPPTTDNGAPVPPSTFDGSPDALLAQVAANSPTIEKIARGAFRRARRAISIGPTVGLFGASIPSPGDTDLALTFGLGVETFKVPVLPTIDNLKAIVMERAKAKLGDAIKARFAGNPPDAATLEQMGREIWEEAVQEVLGLENVRAKTMERPQFTFGVEANRYFDSDVWMTRLRVGLGVWKLTLAGSVSAAFTDPTTSVFTGVEVVAHFLPSKNPRASVLDAYLRGDFEVRNRSTQNTDTIALVVRYLVDLL